MAPKILVVDDDTETRNVFQMALTKLGYETTITEDVPAALDYLDTTTPDVILLDIMLPGQLGLDLLTHVRRTPALAGVFVVIVSAHLLASYPLPEDVHPDVVLRKPIRLPELRQLLSKALA